MDPKSSPLRRSPWRKNLYQNHEYPDNYTDKSFLVELQKNLHVREVSLSESVYGSLSVTTPVSCVILFAVLFVYIESGWLLPELVMGMCMAVAVIGYLVYILLLWRNGRQASNNCNNGKSSNGNNHQQQHQRNDSTASGRHIDLLEPGQSLWGKFVEDSKIGIMFLAFGYGTAPILKTLTQTVSTDSIYAMTTLAMIVHLIFYDYGVSVAFVSKPLSLNAAIFGSVCLASRLVSVAHAFVLLTTAVELFVLLPWFLRVTHNKMFMFVTLAIVSFTICGLVSLSHTIAALFVLFLLFLNVACPYWFVDWHTHKENLHGPWDEAVLEDT